MSNKEEVQNYIRYQLSQLRFTNQHHHFEDLCQDLARLTICERILPATGPVAGTGDQGRDFETFRSYLQSTPIATSTFLGKDVSVDNRVIVFACSLQETGIQKKIKGDVDTILAGGVPPDAIYFYSVANIKVATRHSLQAWCHDTYNVLLEILDINALSQLLCIVDNFWVASSHLSIPTNLYPTLNENNSKYSKLKERWLTIEHPPGNSADLSELRYGIRAATRSKGHKADLPLWIDKLVEYRSNSGYEPDRRTAAYEICVAALRGLNDLTKRRELVESYFNTIDDIHGPAGFSDAATLLKFCAGAVHHGHFDFPVETIEAWRGSLITLVEKRLSETQAPASRCSLLQSLGSLSLCITSQSSDFQLALSTAYDWWDKLLDEAQSAPLYPLDEFSDLLNTLIKMVDTHERLVSLTDRADELICERTSGYVAAEKCRDRANSFIEIERYTQAIRQLHTTKTQWFTAETLNGSVYAMLVLSICYKNLGLFQASKYYAMSALCLSQQSDDYEIKKIAPHAAFQLFDSCFAGGEWASALQAIEFAWLAQNAFAPDPQEIQDFPQVSLALMHLYSLRTATDKFCPTLVSNVDTIISELPLDDTNKAEFQKLVEDKNLPIAAMSADDVWKNLQDEFFVRPFSDLGSDRVIRWMALGIEWQATTVNRYFPVCAIETLVATAQIVICDLSNTDLELLPTNVHIECVIDDVDDMDIDDQPGNDKIACVVTFPRDWLERGENTQKMHIGCLSLMASLLVKCSVKKPDEFLVCFHKAMEDGLSHKTFSVRSYTSLYQDYFPQNTFNKIDRQNHECINPETPFALTESDELAWNDSLGPSYSEEDSLVDIRHRYNRSIVPIRLSLKAWLKDEKFLSLLKTLREKKWQDWRILLLLANAALNYRIDQKVGAQTTPTDMRNRTKELMGKAETENDMLVPLSVITDNLETHVHMQTATIAKTWGLCMNRQTPDLEALQRYLTVRYRLEIDDIEHENPFKLV